MTGGKAGALPQAPSTVTLFDGRTALGSPVLAAIDGSKLLLSPPDGDTSATWPLASLVRCDVGAPGESAVFRQAGPERLAIADPALLAALRVAGVDFGHAPHWSGRRWAGFSALLAASLALGAVLIDQLPGLVAPLVPARLERGWSSAIQAALSAEAPVCGHAAGNLALTGLVARLATAAGLDHPPPLAVLDTGLVNAFTLPDGRILVLRGLIDDAGGPDELSGVLAHELGHVRRRDPTREMLRGLALNMVARSLGWGSSVAGQMTALSYGRRAEAAADASAIVALRRAGLRADGLRRFFQRMLMQHGEAPLAFLSDHPATAQRIDRLDTDSGGAPALDAPSWLAVRAVCAG